MNIFYLIITAFILSAVPCSALEESWNRHDHFDSRTTGYSLRASSFLLNAELIDTTGFTWSRRTGLDQFRAVITRPKTLGGEFQAEIQGVRAQEGEEWGNTFSFLRHDFNIMDSENGRLSFQSRLYAPSGDARPGIGIPFDYRISRKQNAGISFMAEQGKFNMGTDITRKYIVSMYYGRQLLSRISAALNYYAEKYEHNRGLNYSHLNAGVNFQTKEGITINTGTFASLTSGPVVFNHFLGTSFFF